MGYPATRALADAFVRIHPDTAGFREEARTKIKAALAGAGQTVKVSVIADVSPGEILALKRKFQQAGLSDFLGTNMSAGQIQSQILLLKRRLDQAKLSDFLGVNINTSALVQQVAKLRAESLSIPVSFEVAGPLPTIASSSKTLTIKAVGFGDAAAQVAGLAQQVDLLTGWLELLDVELDRKKEAFKQLGGSLFATTAAMAAASAGANATAKATAGATRTAAASIPLWAAATSTFGLVALGLHLALEGFVAIVPAAAALGITLYAMVPAAQDVYQHLKSIDTVNSSLGSNIPPLTGKFAALQAAMAPAVLELYGGGLLLISRNSGILGQTVTATSHVLEGWLVNIQLWAAHQNTLSKILQDGVAFLQQWGRVFGDIGIALANLVRADPGVAHFLLDIVQGAAKVLDWITKLPAPFLTFVLALHAVYFYGRLAGGVLLKLASVAGLDKVAGSLAKIIGLGNVSSRAWLSIAAGAIAIGFLAYQLTRADKATRDFIDAQNALLSQTPASKLFGEISVQIGQTVDQIQGVPAKVAAAGNAVRANAKSFFGDLLDEAKARSFQAVWSNAVNAVSSVFHGLGLDVHATSAEFQQSADITAYKNHIDSLLSSESNLAKTLVYVASGASTAGATFTGLGSTTATVGAAVGDLSHHFNALGTSAKTVHDNTLTVEQSLALMDLAGVQANDTFAVMKQKVDNLVNGYKNMGVQGGILANSVNAVTFQTELQGSKVAALTGAWDTFFTLVSGGEAGMLTFAQAMQTLDTASGLTGTQIHKLTGYTGAFLTQQQDFVSAAGAAQKELDALTQLSAAAGAGAAGTNALTQATKDMLQQLLPAAKNSQTLTTILYALAQQGGYTGADSFKELSKWVGKTVNPEKDLTKQTQFLTVAAGNLTTDTNNLANAISGQLNAAMSQAIFVASGGQKAFDKFATSVLGAHGDIQAMVPSAVSLGRELLITTGSTTAAHKEFDVFAIGLGLTRGAADKLWQESLPALQHTIDGLHGKQITISMGGDGSYVITGKIIAASQGPGGSGSSAGGLARGGKITAGSGPTADDVIVAVSKGETVVSAGDSKRLAPLFGSMGIPGYATGGKISGSVAALSPFATGFYNAFSDQMRAAEIHQMLAALKTGEKAAIAAAIAAAGVPGLGGPVPAGLESVARYALQHGATKAAAAGIGGVIAGESGGNPEILQGGGGGGAGLLQWTPASSAFPIQPIITGNVGRDMAAQLVDMIAYINSRGGMGAINAAGASGGALSAAYRFSAMEAPAVPGSDVRPAVVAQLLAEGYDKGGRLPRGLSLAWNGTGRSEVVAPSGLDDLRADVQDIAAAVDSLAGQHEALMTQLIRVTGGQAGQFASVLSGAARSNGYSALYNTSP